MKSERPRHSTDLFTDCRLQLLPAAVVNQVSFPVKKSICFLLSVYKENRGFQKWFVPLSQSLV